MEASEKASWFERIIGFILLFISTGSLFFYYPDSFFGRSEENAKACDLNRKDIIRQIGGFKRTVFCGKPLQYL